MEELIRRLLGSDASLAADPSDLDSGSALEAEDLALMEQFLRDPAHDYRNLKYGDTVDGRIMRVDHDEILVDIGAKAEGIVPSREMQSLAPEDRAALQVGDVLLVFVVQSEGKEGRAILSVDKARQERSWRVLQSAFEKGDVISARVVNYNKGGLLVNLDGVRGFVPASQLRGISRGPETQKQSDMAKMVNTDLTLKVIEINRNRNRLILSERQVVQESREIKKDELLARLQEGDVRTGIVSSVCDFGAFVDIGGADGLVHLSEISWSRVKSPSEVLKVGDKVQVYILSIDNERKRIALSIKRTQSEPWTRVDERYQLGQIVEGTITQLASFGAFARIEDGIEGLIHISEMSDERIQHPKEILSEGQVVQARIIRIDPARKRMGLSLRLYRPNNELDEDDEDDNQEHLIIQTALRQVKSIESSLKQENQPARLELLISILPRRLDRNVLAYLLSEKTNIDHVLKSLEFYISLEQESANEFIYDRFARQELLRLFRDEDFQSFSKFNYALVDYFLAHPKTTTGKMASNIEQFRIQQQQYFESLYHRLLADFQKGLEQARNAFAEAEERGDVLAADAVFRVIRSAADDMEETNVINPFQERYERFLARNHSW